MCDLQADMLARAAQDFTDCIELVHTWDEFMAALGRGHMALAPWCAPLHFPPAPQHFRVTSVSWDIVAYCVRQLG